MLSRRRVGPGGSRAGLRRPGTLLGLASGSGSLRGLALSALARPLRAAPGNPPPARRVPVITRSLLRTARPPPGPTRPAAIPNRDLSFRDRRPRVAEALPDRLQSTAAA